MGRAAPFLGELATQKGAVDQGGKARVIIGISPGLGGGGRGWFLVVVTNAGGT